MTKAEEYRARAIECDQLAEQAKDPLAKRTLREAGKNWRSMVEEAERAGPTAYINR